MAYSFELSQDWQKVLSENCLKKISSIIDRLIQEKSVFYPPFPKIFAALNACSPFSTKVIIIGQDPYFHGEADGFAFSSTKGIPPSLKNIRDEIAGEYGKAPSSLSMWANDGVLLLNQILTVGNSPMSHNTYGWQQITRAIVDSVIKLNPKVVILAFGAKAKEFLKGVSYEFIIAVGHPSPLNTTCPFKGCNVFRLCNERLLKNKLKPVRWAN
jgi:uracil-DNA glycosylase